MRRTTWRPSADGRLWLASSDRVALRRLLQRRPLAAAMTADALLISDYGSGLVTPAFVSRLRGVLKREGHPIPVLIDSRYRVLDYRGLTACTPNESEAEKALDVRTDHDRGVLEAAAPPPNEAEVEQAPDVRIDDDGGVLERAGRDLLQRTGMQAVLITRGGRGM